MSLDHFQRAVADLVASPQACVQLDHDHELLDGYDLTGRERLRLVAMANHGGMSHNCTLYRANRLTPIARCLPRTCLALGEHLRDTFDGFLDELGEASEFDLQFRVEAERFARFVRSRRGVDERVGSCLDIDLAELTEEFSPEPSH
jgi:hypothetical protein